MRDAETCLTEDMLSADKLTTIREAARYCHATRVVLFGSRATSTHTPLSDIDLAIQVRGGVSDLARFIRCMDEDLPGFLEVDVVSLKGHLPDSMREDIEREGIVLYEED